MPASTCPQYSTSAAGVAPATNATFAATQRHSCTLPPLCPGHVTRDNSHCMHPPQLYSLPRILTHPHVPHTVYYTAICSCFSLPLHQTENKSIASLVQRFALSEGFHLGWQPAGCPATGQTLAGPASCQAYTLPYQNTAQATQLAHGSTRQLVRSVAWPPLWPNSCEKHDRSMIARPNNHSMMGSSQPVCSL